MQIAQFLSENLSERMSNFWTVWILNQIRTDFWFSAHPSPNWMCEACNVVVVEGVRDVACQKDVEAVSEEVLNGEDSCGSSASGHSESLLSDGAGHRVTTATCNGMSVSVVRQPSFMDQQSTATTVCADDGLTERRGICHLNDDVNVGSRKRAAVAGDDSDRQLTRAAEANEKRLQLTSKANDDDVDRRYRSAVSSMNRRHQRRPMISVKPRSSGNSVTSTVTAAAPGDAVVAVATTDEAGCHGDDVAMTTAASPCHQPVTNSHNDNSKMAELSLSACCAFDGSRLSAVTCHSDTMCLSDMSDLSRSTHSPHFKPGELL